MGVPTRADALSSVPTRADGWHATSEEEEGRGQVQPGPEEGLGRDAKKKEDPNFLQKKADRAKERRREQKAAKQQAAAEAAAAASADAQASQPPVAAPGGGADSAPGRRGGDPRAIARFNLERDQLQQCATVRYGYLSELYASPRFQGLSPEVRCEQLGAVLSHYAHYAVTHEGGVAPYEFPDWSQRPLKRRQRRRSQVDTVEPQVCRSRVV